MLPLVSIIIPCFNSATWLGETLSSCISQTYRKVEVIFVDNDSSDESLDIARNFKSSKIHITNCDRQGASAARNEGLRIAQGEYIQYLDADDVLANDKIEIQVDRLAETPPNSIASSAWSRFCARPGESAPKVEPVWCDLSPQEYLISSWLGGGMMPLFGWLTPHQQIIRAGVWDETLSTNDDGEYFTRVVLQSAGIVFCSEAAGFYRSGNPSSLSRRVDRRSAESDFKAIHKSCNYLLAANSSALARRASAAAYQRFAYRYYPRFSDLTYQAELLLAKLGGSDLEFEGGRQSQIISSIFGWKTAKRLQYMKNWKKT